jgi:hypothetical protein
VRKTLNYITRLCLTTAIAALTVLAATRTTLPIVGSLGPLLNGPDLFFRDRMLSSYSGVAKETRKDVVVFAFNDVSIEKYQAVSPIDPLLIAKVISEIAALHPKAIGIDLLFDRLKTYGDGKKDENGRPVSDKPLTALIEAVCSHDIPIIFGVVDLPEDDAERSGFDLSEHKRVTSSIVESCAARGKRRPLLGHVHFGVPERSLFSVDEVVRRLPEEPESGRRNYASFSRLLAVATGTDNKAQGNTIDWILSGTTEPIGIYYFPSYVPGAGGGILSNTQKSNAAGRIVIIGGMIADSDRHVTPLSVDSHEKYSGAWIHATIVAQILDNRWPRAPGLIVEFLLVWIIALLGFGAFVYLPSFLWPSMRSPWFHYWLGVMLLIITGSFIFAKFKYILPSVSAFAGWTVGAYLGTRRWKWLFRSE